MDNRDKRPPIKAALILYRRAKSLIERGASEAERDRELARLDLALDRLLAEPSPSFGAFADKIRILELEYGLNAQPRHLAAIYCDVALLAALAVDQIALALPMG